MRTDARRRASPPAPRTAHLPDAVFCPGRVAIEVELTLKSRARLDTIVSKLSQTYEQVWYFATPRLIPTLEEIATVARWQNIGVHRYPPRRRAAHRREPTSGRPRADGASVGISERVGPHS